MEGDVVNIDSHVVKIALHVVIVIFWKFVVGVNFKLINSTTLFFVNAYIIRIYIELAEFKFKTVINNGSLIDEKSAERHFFYFLIFKIINKFQKKEEK